MATEQDDIDIGAEGRQFISGDKFELRVGSEIALLRGMPAFKITKIDESKPSMELQYTGGATFDGKAVTQNIVIDGKQPRFLGRTDLSPTNTSLSRELMTIHFNPREGYNVFMMEATNQRNPGTIKHALMLGKERAENLLEAAETMLGDVRPGVEEGPSDMPLRRGMVIKLHPHLPSYTVQKATYGKNVTEPELVLVANGDALGVPPEMRLKGKYDSKSIGRGSGDYKLTKPSISRGIHANMGYDQLLGWTLFTMKTPPEVLIGRQFLTDMEASFQDIKPGTPAAMRDEIDDIDKLVERMQEERADRKNVLQKMEDVQGLEEGTIVTPMHRREKGAKTEDSQDGYRYWLQAYKMLYKERLTPEANATLNDAMFAMQKMAVDRADLRDFQNYPNLEVLPKGAANILKQVRDREYSSDMGAVVDSQLKSLKLVPPKPAYLVSGFQRHHTVTKIEKNDKGYVVTVYNAGADSKPSPDVDGQVMAMYKQRLKPGVKIEDYARLVNERKIRSYWSEAGTNIAQAMEDMLHPPEKWRSEPPQRKGNCTTRSTRGMIRDMFENVSIVDKQNQTHKLFEHLHSHVSDPDVCDPAEIMEALQMRRAILDGYVQKEGEQHVKAPASIVDWRKSANDLHSQLSDSRSGEPGSWVAHVANKKPFQLQ